MAQWIEWDTALFRWINYDLANPFFDGLMPLASSKQLLPLGFIALGLIAIKIGRRGFPALLCLAAIIGLGEGLVLSPLKEWIGRPRPPVALDDVRLIVGLGGSGSMPSAHAANWSCTVTVLALFYPPSLFLTVPLGVLVSFSRVYNGVHYPADVLVGWCLGAAYGYAGVLALHHAWRHLTQRWFPRVHAYLPSLLPPAPSKPEPTDNQTKQRS